MGRNEINLKGYSLYEHNKIFVKLDEESITIIDVQTQNIITKFNQLRNSSHVNFSADDKFMAIKTTNGTIGLISLKDFSLLKVILYNKEGPEMVFTNDSKYILDGDLNGKIRKINTETGTISFIRTNLNCKIKKIVFNSDNGEAIIFVFIRKNVTEVKGLYVSKLDMNNEELFINSNSKILDGLGDVIYSSSLKQFILLR